MTIEDQHKLFEKIAKRELTEDEKYFIRNAFLNGIEEGYIRAFNEIKEFVVKRS